ncbi:MULTISPECIES: hypothetical protein [Laceyella]|jgi:hypothetical protein|uniref:Uncharacterized protein n=1 Tax=Laceyella sacchari TaxID=37482 RepID=A0ABY5U5G9_LACSH|nr:hypothetical protein [Laceyella sacchari]UWE04887.1 hypothetical protein NYR52_07140 [Laceyella sacchari]
MRKKQADQTLSIASDCFQLIPVVQDGDPVEATDVKQIINHYVA